MSKSKTKKKEEPKQGELIKFTNGMIDAYVNRDRNPAITKLRQLVGIGSDIRMKIFTFTNTVHDSPQAKALLETINEMVREHEDRQKDLEDEKKTTLNIDAPEIKEFFKLESGLEVRKIIMPSNRIPDHFTAEDMLATKWFVEWVE